MYAPIVYFDIAGPDSVALRSFYALVFGWNSTEAGQFSTGVASPLPGTLRQDPAEKRIYIGVDDVAAKLAQIEDNGGSIGSPRFEVPGVAVLGLFKDPAGNPMGLVEMDGDQPKVP